MGRTGFFLAYQPKVNQTEAMHYLLLLGSYSFGRAHSIESLISKQASAHARQRETGVLIKLNLL